MWGWLRGVGRYIQNVLLGVDQLGNTIAGGAPDETISARVGRRRDKDPLAHVIADGLDKIQKDHCKGAIESELRGRQQAKIYKDVYDPEDEEIIKVILKEKDIHD